MRVRVRPTSVLFLTLILARVDAAFSQQTPSSPVEIDHIILGVNDLQRGIAAFTRLTGVAPQLGGRHPGRGTQNALVSLGEGHYLEILAPSSQPRDSTPAELIALEQLTPIGWALHTGNIAALVARLRARGFLASDPRPGSRRRPDGTVLTWQTAGVEDTALALAPFFIEWGSTTPHPSTTSPTGCRLLDLRLIEPNVERLARFLDAVGFRARIEAATSRRMVVTLACPQGSVSFAQ